MFNQGDSYTQQFTVTEAVYNGFLNAFGDRNPLHTDEAYAMQKGFQGRVMHGNILNGFLSYFIGECLPTKDVIIHSQSIQFNKPVFLNDTLLLEAQVAEVIESVKVVSFKYTFKNAEGKRVAKGEIQIGLTA
ncbi:MAG: MaoC/PaaZ C-terminal domain-containing protein [Sediminibacterium sp.]|nr:MaoC/PaaZ C-terminal domain-containing protein [Sediminibacterium sp.]